MFDVTAKLFYCKLFFNFDFSNFWNSRIVDKQLWLCATFIIVINDYSYFTHGERVY